MEHKPQTDISTLGEFGLIRHLTENFPPRNASTLKGVGDDAAVLDYGNKRTSSPPTCCSKAYTSTSPTSR